MHHTLYENLAQVKVRTKLIKGGRALNSLKIVQNMMCSNGDTVNESNSTDNIDFTYSIKHSLENNLS